jgi:hypothetical protein
MLGWTLGSALGMAVWPTLAAAQAEDTQTALDLLPADGGPMWAVTNSDASLRGDPTISNNRFAFARPGTPLQVLGYEGDWAYVFNPHTQGTAYIASSLLAPGLPPSRFVSMPAPPLIDDTRTTIVLPQDSVLAAYPSAAPEAVFMPLPASTREAVVGTVEGDDGSIWYQTADFYYVPQAGVFDPTKSDEYGDRWLLANLLPRTRVVAFQGQTAVRSMLALRGTATFPTPVGVFSIERRVPNETMDSLTVGIPRDSPNGYLVKNVLWTQYFTPDGASFHDNYWSSNFGGAGSHGCLGLNLADSKWLWDWARIGTPVIVTPS